MDAVTVTADMTATEFLALPLRPDGRIRRELIDGEIVVSEASWTHNESQVTVLFALRTWVRDAPQRGSVGLPLDVLLDERNVHCPDVVWYRHGRSPERGDPPPYPIPDIAVEIRSPSTWRYDIGAKKAHYERRPAGAVARRHVGGRRARVPALAAGCAAVRRQPRARQRRQPDVAAAAGLLAARGRDLRGLTATVSARRGSPSRSARPSSACARPAPRRPPAQRSSRARRRWSPTRSRRHGPSSCRAGR
jgi:hypothetical protein